MEEVEQKSKAFFKQAPSPHGSEIKRLTFLFGVFHSNLRWVRETHGPLEELLNACLQAAGPNKRVSEMVHIIDTSRYPGTHKQGRSQILVWNYSGCGENPSKQKMRSVFSDIFTRLKRKRNDRMERRLH